LGCKVGNRKDGKMVEISLNNEMMSGISFGEVADKTRKRKTLYEKIAKNR